MLIAQELIKSIHFYCGSKLLYGRQMKSTCDQIINDCDCVQHLQCLCREFYSDVHLAGTDPSLQSTSTLIISWPDAWAGTYPSCYGFLLISFFRFLFSLCLEERPAVNHSRSFSVFLYIVLEEIFKCASLLEVYILWYCRNMAIQVRAR